jgi:hypothetical protein
MKWIVAVGVLVALVAGVVVLAVQRRRRREAIRVMFDDIEQWQAAREEGSAGPKPDAVLVVEADYQRLADTLVSLGWTSVPGSIRHGGPREVRRGEWVIAGDRAVWDGVTRRMTFHGAQASKLADQLARHLPPL